MGKWVAWLLLAGFCCPAWAAKTMTVAEMEQLLAKFDGKPDKKVASELGEVQLTERVSRARLERWEAQFTGSHTREELMRLADLAAFEQPPAADVIAQPPPDKATQLRILAQTLAYVRTAISRLPDFYATRGTTHFENTINQQIGYTMGSTRSRSLRDVNVSPTGMSSTGEFAALHSTGQFSATVTYRDGREVRDEDAGTRKKEEGPSLGMTSSGEFGPILGAVIGDLLHSGLRWLRWEQGPSGPAAVFGFTIPQNQSHFRLGISGGNKAEAIFPAYHGELKIDPETGGILRLSEVADIAPPHQAMRAAVMVEYAPVTIGDRSYLCPARAVAFTKTPMPVVGATDESEWPVQTELNDVVFTNYHEFRTEARILASVAGENGAPAANASAGAGAASEPAAAAALVNTQAPSSDSGAASLASSPPVAQAAAAPATNPTPVATEQAAITPAANSIFPAAGPAKAQASAANSTPVATEQGPATPAANPASRAVAATATAAAPDTPTGKSMGAMASGMVFYAKSNLVVLDVAVTEHDRPVKELDERRFHIYEDGREQQIASFDEHQPAAGVTLASPGALPPNTYSNTPVYPETGAVNVLLLDALNTPSADQERVRRVMIDYIGTIKPGTAMAIFTLSSRLRMAAGFTTDFAQLLKVLQREKANARGPSAVGSGKGSDLSTDLEHAASSVAVSSDPGTIWLVGQIMQFAADMKSYDTDQRESITLEAFNELARYLAAIPGRKNVIWFSGSFPIGIGPDALVRTQLKNVRDYSGDVTRTSELLAAARVAVYPVDARGLMTAPASDATYIAPPMGGFNDPRASVRNDNSSFVEQTSLEQGSMSSIAAETGGRVYSAGNDLKAALEKITANDSYYYALSYVPPQKDSGRHGAEFHKIEVKLDGGKYQLDYRRGYYTDDTSKLAGNAGGVAGPMTAAAVPGAPPSTQILFQAQVLPEDDAQLSGKAPESQPAGETAAGANAGSHRYVVDLEVQLNDLTFAPEADGATGTRFECALVAYDGEAKPVKSLARSFDYALPADQYERLSAADKSVSERLAVDLPAAAVGVRIVVYDPASAKTGSLEIPLHVPSR